MALLVVSGRDWGAKIALEDYCKIESTVVTGLNVPTTLSGRDWEEAWPCLLVAVHV